ncbi:ABC transporter permease [Allostreptomyces psammosilenae]|uniref:Oligopeptide transport system permease protein n=1 Tax=Allostreptomyces psammosilenae TaxID=1892865 RepID=A0A853A0C0_9ACTN|nr:ABC transporter permease [Allostreptomyces psammosilenae]NYI08073.1 oligopeptide transport system permease protein [Allostreptomyces psammosilenae]
MSDLTPTGRATRAPHNVEDTAPGSESIEAEAATATPPPSGTPTPGRDQARSQLQIALGDLIRSPLFLVSLVCMAFLAVVAVFPGLFTNANPAACDLGNSMAGPSDGHPFGYDFQGCDLYARTVYGARNSIAVGLLATLLSAIVGGLLGILGGYFGGWLDTLLSWVTNIFFGLPLLLGAIVILNSLGRPEGVWGVTLALGAFGWMAVARMMRASVMVVKNQDYVVAAKSLGAGTGRMMLRHVLPNSLTSLIVYSTILLGVTIAAEATLSFLGAGIQPPAISWGVMISEAQARISTDARPLLIPAAALSFTVLTFIMLGEAVRDALDPKLR